MATISKLIDAIVSKILYPMFGDLWSEITFCIAAALFVAFIITVIILGAKYSKAKKCIKYLNSKNEALEKDLKSNELKIKNLSDSLVFVKGQLELRDAEISDLTSKCEIKDARCNDLEKQLEESALRIKRLEAARKATRTIAAKKKKQSAEETNTSENDEEIVD